MTWQELAERGERGKAQFYLTLFDGSGPTDFHIIQGTPGCAQLGIVGEGFSFDESVADATEKAKAKLAEHQAKRGDLRSFRDNTLHASIELQP